MANCKNTPGRGPAYKPLKYGRVISYMYFKYQKFILHKTGPFQSLTSMNDIFGLILLMY